MINFSKPEIMAPAGSFESLSAAINAGCDSVYLGVTQLNMRARSAYNFEIADLPEVSKMAKAAGIKVYVTMNTLLYQHDLNLMRKIIDAVQENNLDAIIAQDFAAIQYAREKGVHVHASTQLSISNFESVKFFAQFADTIVLARELDLPMIENIIKRVHEEDVRGPAGNLVRIECFVHGALCIAQSGRCQMSLITNNTSAQRGACLQECRKKYRLIDEENGNELVVENDGYIMSPKDLCTIPFLDQLYHSGISVFKIEGRARAPEYVDTVIKVYREAVDAIEAGNFNQEKVTLWMERLGKVYNRGFSDGYFLGKKLPDWAKVGGSVATEEKVFVGLVKHYFEKAKVAEVQVQAHPLKVGEKILVMGKHTGVIHGEVTSMRKDDSEIVETGSKDLITISFPEKVRENDKLYILKPRTAQNVRH